MAPRFGGDAALARTPGGTSSGGRDRPRRWATWVAFNVAPDDRPEPPAAWYDAQSLVPAS